jgi:hypothetical protein
MSTTRIVHRRHGQDHSKTQSTIFALTEHKIRCVIRMQGRGFGKLPDGDCKVQIFPSRTDVMMCGR